MSPIFSTTVIWVESREFANDQSFQNQMYKLQKSLYVSVAIF